MSGDRKMHFGWGPSHHNHHAPPFRPPVIIQTHAPFCPHCPPHHHGQPNHACPSHHVTTYIPPTTYYPPPSYGQTTSYGSPGLGYTWEPTSSGACRSLTYKAVSAGRDSDGTEIFVGRASYQGDLVPAKVIPSKNIAYISHNMQEIPMHNFEMFVRNEVSWVPSSDGNVPYGAVEVGRTAQGEPLYMGRVHHDGALTPGKVHRSHGCCYVPYNMTELSFKQYEVLVLV